VPRKPVEPVTKMRVPANRSGIGPSAIIPLF
jgi:hypothetical protein